MAVAKRSIGTRVVGSKGGFVAVTESVQDFDEEGRPLGNVISSTSVWSPHGVFICEFADPAAALEALAAMDSSIREDSDLSPRAKIRLRRKSAFDGSDVSVGTHDKDGYAYEILDSSGLSRGEFHSIAETLDEVAAIEGQLEAEANARKTHRMRG